MKISVRHCAVLASLACAMLASPFATAQAYVEHYVSIGNFQTQDGETIQVYMDTNQPNNFAAGGLNAAVKIMVPSQDYYHSLVSPSEIFSSAGMTMISDTNASYYTEGVRIDCAHKTVSQGLEFYYNAEGQLVADHNDGMVPEAIEANTLGSVLMQKLCGS